MVPPGLLEVPGVDRVGIDSQLSGERITKKYRSAFHMIAGGYQQHGTDLPAEDHVTTIDGILQGIPGGPFQDDTFRRRVARSRTVEVTLAHRRINPDEKEIGGPAFAVQAYTLVHPALPAGQHNNGIGLDRALPV